MSISNFLYTYFLLPYQANQGYNLINSLTYGAIFVILIYLATKLLEKMNIKVTKRTIFSLLPFILLGSALRVMEDANLLPQTFFLVTPSIYVIIIAITSVVFLLCHKFTKNPDRNVAIAGLVLAAIPLSFLRLNNFDGLMFISTIFLGILIIMAFLRGKTKFFKNDLNFIGVASHMLDATATFVTMQLFSYLGYWEQHPVTRLVGTLGHTFAWFYILKLFVIVVLYYIDKDVKDERLKNMLKFGVIVLGLAPGLRDSLRLIMLV